MAGVRVVGLTASANERLRAALADLPKGFVLDATEADQLRGWDELERLLERGFVLLREAKQEDTSVVVIVHADDLLGRRGALAGMAAGALTSSVRTLALETRKLSLVANVLAPDGEQDHRSVSDAARWLLGGAGVTGQVIAIGRSNLGKVPT